MFKVNSNGTKTTINFFKMKTASQLQKILAFILSSERASRTFIEYWEQENENKVVSQVTM